MVIVSIAALGLFIAMIQGLRPPENTRTFYVYLNDTAGINKGADVRFGGTKVGRVEDIALDPADKSRLRVVASVREDVPVNEKSMASVTQVTLTSEMHLEISTGEKEAPLLKDRAELPSRPGGLAAVSSGLIATLDEVNLLLGGTEAKEKEDQGEGELVTIAEIFEGIGDTLEGGGGIVTKIEGVIDDSNEDVSEILDKVKEIEDTAKGALEDLRTILEENRGNIKGITDGVNETIQGVQPIIEDVKPILERLSELSEELDEMAATIQGTLDNAEVLSGDAQDLLKSNRLVIEDILLDLRETIRHLKTFSRTMAEQPEAVIRGKTPEGRR